MSKEAIIFSIDAGSSMDQKFIDSDSTKLKIALECLRLTLQQKLFTNSNHQIGFTLFGQNQADSDDGNNTLLKPISKPDLEFVRKVLQLSQISLNNQKIGGDIFSAIDFVIQRLVDHCGTKKYNKRAFLFTNGKGETKLNQQDFKSIVQSIKKHDIKLNIIPIDFMQTYDLQSNLLQNEIFDHQIQQQNSELLIKLRSLCPQNIQIFPASLAIELYKKFRKKDTNPVALFRGKFEIAPNMAIEVCSYKAIRRQKLNSLSKFDLTIPFDPVVRKQKDIQTDINYVMKGNQNGTIVDKDQVMNAYEYGNNMVPMNQMIENATKIFEQKNFTLLGFVESQKIPRHCFFGGVDIVVPQKEDEISRKLFSAFIYSMLVQKKYAIARYVPRNYKRGVSPKMVVLIPYRSPERQMFYLIQLPTIEGIREYPFNSLKASNQKQNELVKNLVDKMMLVQIQDDRQKESVKVQNLFNPYRQYFYQTIFYRALNEDQKDAVPELDDVTKKYITPEVRIYEKTAEDMEAIKRQFRFKTNELARDKVKQKKVIVWKDILAGELAQNDLLEQTEASVGQQIGKKFTFETQDDDKFNPVQPIVSFRKMINNNKKDLVSQALNNLTNYIQKKNHSSNSEQQNDHLVQCAKELRKACIEQKEADFWDEWFQKSNANLTSGLYRSMKVAGLGFLKRSNEQVFKVQYFEMRPVTLQVDELD